MQSVVISMFYGIIIRMPKESDIKNSIPYVIAQYQEHEIVIDLEGNTLNGDIPKKQRKLLLAWLVLREEYLKANWQLLKTDNEYFRVDPLQ